MKKNSKEIGRVLDVQMASGMKSRFLSLIVVAAFAAIVSPSLASATSYLGSAQSFAVLGNATTTNTGSTTIYGNVGVYAGSAITGFPPAVVTGGTIYTTDGVAQQAQSDALTAYNILKVLPNTSFWVRNWADLRSRQVSILLQRQLS